MEQTALATVLIADADMLGLLVKELCLMNTTIVVVLKRVLVLVDIIPHIETEYVVIVLLLIHALGMYVLVKAVLNTISPTFQLTQPTVQKVQPAMQRTATAIAIAQLQLHIGIIVVHVSDSIFLW
jgi:hypothetical protein